MILWHGQILEELVARHQEARSRVTEAQVDAFMAVREMKDLFGPWPKQQS